VRHPFYVSVALLAIGSTLAAASWFLGLTAAMFMSLIVMRTAIEEEKLAARFGDSYREYMRHTGRFWPK
jgi:protein-S-isoprenylcysteine O-methyltransferase Ste14